MRGAVTAVRAHDSDSVREGSSKSEGSRQQCERMTARVRVRGVVTAVRAHDKVSDSDSESERSSESVRS